MNKNHRLFSSKTFSIYGQSGLITAGIIITKLIIIGLESIIYSIN